MGGMKRERVLITVKTYPTLSKKYGETVCTAGVREDGSWVRLYPVPFRRLEEAEQYKKFDWVECDVVKARNDPRPESHNPTDLNQLHEVGHIGTEDNWRERRQLLLQTCTVHDRLDTVIQGAKANEMSLAVFRPTKIKDFIWEKEDRDWDPKRLAAMRNSSNQGELFAEDQWRNAFKIIPKLPYSFSYRFEDADGTTSTLQILDWEIGALFWNCMRRHGQDETIALEKVRQKYVNQFFQKDLHFFLGTTQSFHFVGPNPWVIIGVLPIPHENRLELF